MGRKKRQLRASRLEESSGKKPLLIILAIVCGLVTFVHWPVLDAEALSFDDTQYLTENVLVQNPSVSNAMRFLREVSAPSTVRGYYQPLTMISLMVDHAIGGSTDNLMPFHRTSLILHVLNTAMVVVLLYMLFGRAVIAGAVGLLFGLHPMTVETIAWVGERKTVLAAFFCFLSLILYVCYTQKKDKRFYYGSLFVYLLAVMSKPISVPMPILMVLIDYWPMRRIEVKTIVEKIPFFVISGIFAIITVISQGNTANMSVPDAERWMRIPFILCHNIIFYLHKIVWPVQLSSHYAFPSPLDLSNSRILAGVIGTLVLVPVLVISLRRTRACLTGWLFFFIAMLPTMQIIGFSNVIASDKFAYFPSFGLLMMISWGCVYLLSKKKSLAMVVLALVLIVVPVSESHATRKQLSYWENTSVLFEHMMDITPGLAVLHNDLGIALFRENDYVRATEQFKKALELDPYNVKANDNLGAVLIRLGRNREAEAQFRKTLVLVPGDAKSHSNLGTVLNLTGRTDEAIAHYKAALQTMPDNFQTHYALGMSLIKKQKLDEATQHFKESIRIMPSWAKAYFGLAEAMRMKGDMQGAVDYYRMAVEKDPAYFNAIGNLATVLKAVGKTDEAIKWYLKAIEVDPSSASTYYNLGLTYESQGNNREAVKYYNKTLQIDSGFDLAKQHIIEILKANGEI